MAPPNKETVHRSMKRLFKQYIRKCRARNIFWELTLEQFQELTSQNCAYCGTKPSQLCRSYKYNGLDRKDSSKGYHMGNVNPCCGECNGIKSNRLTADEMLVVGQALKQFRQRRI